MTNEFTLYTLNGKLIEGAANNASNEARTPDASKSLIPARYQPLKLDYARIAELQALSAQTIAFFHSK